MFSIRHCVLPSSSTAVGGGGKCVKVVTRGIYDRSQVPRYWRDVKARKESVADYGYHYNHYIPGEKLPRIPGEMSKVRGYEELQEKETREREKEWTEDEARLGQNDYIDILGNGKIHPAQLLYHVPPWLRGFPGAHKANELVRIIHYRNLYKQRMQRVSPLRWHDLCKRINYLLKYHNYKKADEIKNERSLGLWEEEADYFHKDKERRSFKDIP